MADPAVCKIKKLKVVSFASEGPPHDEGTPLDIYLEVFGAACLAGGADEFLPFTPRTLIAADPTKAWSVRNTGEENTMEFNLNYHKIGLGAWRAVLLNRVISESDDGDIVVFHDPNFIKYPRILLLALKIRKYVEKLFEFAVEGDIFAPMHYKVGLFTKPSILKTLVPDLETRCKISEAPMGRARLIIARVSQATREFAKLFEKTCENTFLLSQESSSSSEYIRNIAEQSVFNALAYSTGMFPLDWRGTWINKYNNMGIFDDSMADVIINQRQKIEFIF